MKLYIGNYWDIIGYLGYLRNGISLGFYGFLLIAAGQQWGFIQGHGIVGRWMMKLMLMLMLMLMLLMMMMMMMMMMFPNFNQKPRFSMVTFLLLV